MHAAHHVPRPRPRPRRRCSARGAVRMLPALALAALGIATCVAIATRVVATNSAPVAQGVGTRRWRWTTAPTGAGAKLRWGTSIGLTSESATACVLLHRLRGGEAMDTEGTPFTAEQLKTLEGICSKIDKNPKLINAPELKFFKTFIEETAATIRAMNRQQQMQEPGKALEDSDGNKFSTTGHDGESIGEELVDPGEFTYPVYVPLPVEEDTDKIKEPDVFDETDFNDLPTRIRDEVADEDADAAAALRSEAKKLMREQKYEESIAKFKEALRKNPSASLLSDLATVYIEMKKPNTAMYIADKALKITEESGKAWKVKGKAQNMLGLYKDALANLMRGQRLDFDVETSKEEKYAKDRIPRIQKHEDHKRKYEQERLEAKRVHDEKVKKWQKKQRQKEFDEKRKSRDFYADSYGSGPGAGAGAGGNSAPGGGYGADPRMAGMANNPMMQALMSDPELQAAMSNPVMQQKLMAAMTDMQQGKKPSDPEVQRLMDRLQKKMMGGGAPPGMGGNPFGGGNPMGGSPFGGGNPYAGGSPYGSAPAPAPAPEAPRCQDID